MYEMDKFSATTKEIMDVQLAAAAAMSKQVQAMATEAAEYAKKSAEMNRTYFEKLMGQKSLEGAIEVQTEYAKTAYETFMAESKKFGAIYQDMAREMTKPAEKVAAKTQAVASN